MHQILSTIYFGNIFVDKWLLQYFSEISCQSNFVSSTMFFFATLNCLPHAVREPKKMQGGQAKMFNSAQVLLQCNVTSPSNVLATQ